MQGPEIKELIVVPPGKAQQSSRPTLDTLPHDVLIHIALLLNGSSALALAQVAPSCTEPAEHRLWRDVTIRLPFGYGERPWNKRSRKAYPSNRSESLALEQKRRQALEDKVDRLCEELDADPKRFGLVQKVSLEMRPGAAEATEWMLREVSPTLRRLELEADQSKDSEIGAPESTEALDLVLLDAGITFSALTYLQLGNDTVRFPSFISTMCNSAPNVTTLDLELSHVFRFDVKTEDGSTPQPIPFLPTKIKSLRLSFYDRPLAWENGEPLKTMLELFSHSPHLEHLSFIYREPRGNHYHSYPQLLTAIKGISSLRDFAWTLDADGNEPPRVLPVFDHSTSSSASLRRVGIYNEFYWWIMFGDMHYLPALEVLVLEYLPFQAFHAKLKPQEGPSGIIPILAAQLRRTPRLATIHHLVSNDHPDHRDETGEYIYGPFGVLDWPSATAAYIWSVRHGEHELLHGAYLNTLEKPLACHMTPLGADPERYWQPFSDFEGKVVPLDVIGRMLRMEGLEEAAWQQRGVEVGEAAWKVVIDWQGRAEHVRTFGRGGWRGRGRGMGSRGRGQYAR